MSKIKVGDLVKCCRGKVYRVLAIRDVWGIPAADLIHVRKDGSDGIKRGKDYKNLPLSWLEPAGKPLAEVV